MLLLTATPVNTGLRDLTNLLRVLTKNRRNVWAPEIPDFDRYLKRVERDEVDPYPLLDRSMVRRSRSDILTAYRERAATEPTLEPLTLPGRRLAHVPYRYAAGAGDGGGGTDVFAVFEDVFSGLYLPLYDLERFRRDDDAPVDPDAIDASSLAGLYMTGLLKRFESSVRAVDISLRRLDRRLELFATALEADPPRVLSPATNTELRHLLEREVREDDDAPGALGDEREAESEAVVDARYLELLADARYLELLADAPPLEDPGAFDLDAARAAAQADRDAIARLRAALPDEAHDGKFDALVALLTRSMAGPSIGLRDRRALVFTSVPRHRRVPRPTAPGGRSTPSAPRACRTAARRQQPAPSPGGLPHLRPGRPPPRWRPATRVWRCRGCWCPPTCSPRATTSSAPRRSSTTTCTGTRRSPCSAPAASTG